MGVAGAMYLVLTASFFAACAYAQVRRREETQSQKCKPCVANKPPPIHAERYPTPPHLTTTINAPRTHPMPSCPAPCLAGPPPSQLNDPDPELWIFLCVGDPCPGMALLMSTCVPQCSPRCTRHFLTAYMAVPLKVTPCDSLDGFCFCPASKVPAWRGWPQLSLLDLRRHTVSSRRSQREDAGVGLHPRLLRLVNPRRLVPRSHPRFDCPDQPAATAALRRRGGGGECRWSVAIVQLPVPIAVSTAERVCSLNPSPS